MKMLCAILGVLIALAVLVVLIMRGIYRKVETDYRRAKCCKFCAYRYFCYVCVNPDKYMVCNHFKFRSDRKKKEAQK